MILLANLPIIPTVAQLAHRNGERCHAVCLEQLLQSHNAIVVLVDYGESLPAPVPHNIHISLSRNVNISNSRVVDRKTHTHTYL